MKISYNRDVLLSEVKVFACLPGTGKTYLSKDSKYIDLDLMRSNYKLW